MPHLIINIIIYSVLLVISNTIKVPTTWDLNGQFKDQYRTINLGSEIDNFYIQPYGAHKDLRQIPQRHNNPQTIYQTDNDWIPIFPPKEQQQQQSSFFPNFQTTPAAFPFKNIIYPAEQPDWLTNFEQYPTRSTLPITTRSHTTIKPSVVKNTSNSKLKYHPHTKKIRTTPKPKRNHKSSDQKSAKTEYSHESPPEVPTRPIYPGEGRWAQRGTKHFPHISPHQFSFNQESDEPLPDGYDVFRQNQNLFEKQQSQFQQNLNNIPKTKFNAQFHQDEEAEESDYEDEEPAPFVPTQLYAQVRRSESTEHLPKTIEDPRLKEVVKDSKIQTVYTEEGYEDSAYDHADHEKNAEQDEGEAEFNKDIETEKEPKKRHEDSEPAGSDYQVKPTQQPVPVVLKNQKKDFITTKEIKTTALKSKDDNQDEMEIVSEIKVLVAPNNSTKTHKYVKIMPKSIIEIPKIYRNSEITDDEDESAEISAEAIEITTESPNTLIEIPEVVATIQEDSNGTTTSTALEVDDLLATTEKIEDMPKIIENFESKKVETRQKRSLAQKYPYYNNPKINRDSPLRYSENLQNIPEKSVDELAFYHQADKIECAEVEDNVDPIPDRIKNAEDSVESDDVQELSKSPRLGKLGDKIDCFKLKYFGENPLDNPFFQEATVAPVIPIFGNFPGKQQRKQSINKQREIEEAEEISQKRAQPSENKEIKVSSHSNSSKTEGEITTTETVKIDKKMEETILSDVQSQLSPQNNTENSTEVPVISLMTTPSYTIDLQPKHIYHQIELLQYLPVDSAPQIQEDTSNNREAKNLVQNPSDTVQSTNDTLPTSMPLKRRKRPKISRPLRRRPFHIFDVNRFLPNQPSYFEQFPIYSTTSTPKVRIHSEVDYKHEIKPDEQLNVLTDVINIIKNSSDSAISESEPALNVFKKKRNKFRPKIQNELNLDDYKTYNSFFITSTTVRPIVASTPHFLHPSHKVNNKYFKDLMNGEQIDNLELLKIGSVKSSTAKTLILNDEVTRSDEDKTESDVLGLVPPDPALYHTISATIKPAAKKAINHYFVQGMKPPIYQKFLTYSDFKNPPFVNRRRIKRANRASYTEVVRNRNKPIDVEDEEEPVPTPADDDDYVPHRPKNYHYDEKLGRIVYDRQPETATEAEEEYIEVTDAPLPKPTRRNMVTTPKFIEFEGPSYVEFIKELKSNPKYVAIPDPTTTEKSDEVTTTTTTLSPVSTTPPAFLGILAKVRSDPHYHAIEDKNKTKTTTTTEAAVEIEEEEEEEEEEQLGVVQNSPGGQTFANNFQIFDINEYMPKIRNYSPRTTIDISKYKTIERPNTRHSLSSKYSEEEMETIRSRNKESPAVVEEEDPMKTTSNTQVEKKVMRGRFRNRHPSTTTTTTTTEATTTLSTTTTEESTSATPEIEVTTQRRVRGKFRLTPRTTTTTTESIPSSSDHVARVHQPKAKRVYPRRRPTHIKIATTTEEPDETTKIVHRRHQPPNNEDLEDEDKTPENHRREPKVINHVKSDQIVAKTEKSSDVEIIKPYDETKKHGGNYRRQEDSKTANTSGVKRLTDVVPKPASFYNDPKLPKNINRLMEVDGVESIEEDSEEIEKKSDETEYDDYTDDEIVDEKKIVTTKKPIFIKDPGRRLYYYAPI